MRNDPSALWMLDIFLPYCVCLTYNKDVQPLRWLIPGCHGNLLAIVSAWNSSIFRLRLRQSDEGLRLAWRSVCVHATL